MQRKTLTISVAAYNVENYLEKLCESAIVPEILEDIEILIVNDGSKDRTASIAKEYEQKYPGVFHLIDKPNGGHGSTINKGIELATGKYFRALDGDDWLDQDALLKTVQYLKEHEEDLVFTGFRECYENGDTFLQTVALETNKRYQFEEIASLFPVLKYHTVLYKTDILQNNPLEKLDEHCFYVDSEFMIFPTIYVNTVSYLDVPLYCYRLGLAGQSVSIEGKKKHLKDSIRVAESELQFYEQIKGRIPAKKEAFVMRAIARQCNWHMRLLAEFGPSSQSKKALTDFDAHVKGVSPEIYEQMVTFGKESRMLKMLRKTHFLIYKPMALYKIFKQKIKK